VTVRGLPTAARSLVLDLIVPSNPVPWKRAGINKTTGKVYASRDTEAAKQLLGLLALEQVKRPVEGDIRVEVSFFRGSAQRVDLDNLVKLVWDAFNGVVWVDDHQVVELNGSKAIDREYPRTEVKVWKLVR